MGYMTNQWLKSWPVRKSAFAPGPVSVLAEPISLEDEWSVEREVAAVITLERAHEEYQKIYLTHEEMNESLPVLVRIAEHDTLIKIAIHVLKDLKDSDLYMTTYIIAHSLRKVSLGLLQA